MTPTTLTCKLNPIFALQLLLLTGCSAVQVERVQLDGRAQYASVQGTNATVFACHYRLQPGETLDEVVWVLGGRLVHSYMPTDSSPAVTEVAAVNKFELPNVQRTSAGIYRCTARTRAGAHSTGEFELLVADIPKPVFAFSSYTSNCIYNISLETPAAYPPMTAFCGVWVNRTSSSGQLGFWLESPPPPRTETNEVSYNDDADAVSLRTQGNLSYSTERGDFEKIFYDEDRAGFLLKHAVIKVDDTPENSFIRCFTGFFKKSGVFLPSNSIEGGYTEPPSSKCSNNTLQQLATGHVTVKCSNCQDACRGNLKPSNPSLPLTATALCSKNGVFHTLECQQDDWVLQVGVGAFKGAFQDDLLSFAEDCEKAQAITDDPPGAGDGNGVTGPSGAGDITLLLAISFAGVLLPSLF